MFFLFIVEPIYYIRMPKSSFKQSPQEIHTNVIHCPCGKVIVIDMATCSDIKKNIFYRIHTKVCKKLIGVKLEENYSVTTNRVSENKDIVQKFINEIPDLIRR